MTQLTEDRALAMATLFPRQADPVYTDLTRSGRAEVDRLVKAFRDVRRRALEDVATATADIDHDEDLGTQTPPCAVVWPPSTHDVAHVRCRLPAGHRSPEHWHPALWTGTADLLWWDDGQDALGLGAR